MGNTKTFLIACRTVKRRFVRISQTKAAIRVLLSAFALPVLSSCGELPATTQYTTPTPAESAVNQAAVPKNDPAVSGFFNGTPESEKEAWLLFTKDGRYRVAQFEDFQFPDAARKLQGADLEKASRYPYVGGDINRDGAYNAFAAIVVDTTRTDRNRFGLVIFSQPKDVSTM